MNIDYLNPLLLNDYGMIYVDLIYVFFLFLSNIFIFFFICDRVYLR